MLKNRNVLPNCSAFGTTQRGFIKSICGSVLVVFGLSWNVAIANSDKPNPHAEGESRAEYMQRLKLLVKKIESRIGKTLVASDETEKALVSISTSLSDVDYAELLAVLRVNGFTAYVGGDFIYIIPIKEARSSPVPILEGDMIFPLDQYVSTIIYLEKSCAYKLIPVLRPSVPFNSHLAHLPPGRLLLTDSYGNVMRLKRLISEIEARQTEIQRCDKEPSKRNKKSEGKDSKSL